MQSCKSSQVSPAALALSLSVARLQGFDCRWVLRYRRIAGLVCAIAKLSVDRSTAIGGMIDAYLQSKAEMDDHAIHLLFSANRWEVAYVPCPLFLH